MHVQRKQALITKAVYYIINIISTKAKLFSIRYGISQAVHIQNITKIIVITDAILAAKRIFDISCYSY